MQLTLVDQIGSLNKGGKGGEGGATINEQVGAGRKPRRRFQRWALAADCQLDCLQVMCTPACAGDGCTLGTCAGLTGMPVGYRPSPGCLPCHRRRRAAWLISCSTTSAPRASATGSSSRVGGGGGKSCTHGRLLLSPGCNLRIRPLSHDCKLPPPHLLLAENPTPSAVVAEPLWPLHSRLCADLEDFLPPKQAEEAFRWVQLWHATVSSARCSVCMTLCWFAFAAGTTAAAAGAEGNTASICV